MTQLATLMQIRRELVGLFYDTHPNGPLLKAQEAAQIQLERRFQGHLHKLLSTVQADTIHKFHERPITKLVKAWVRGGTFSDHDLQDTLTDQLTPDADDLDIDDIENDWGDIADLGASGALLTLGATASQAAAGLDPALSPARALAKRLPKTKAAMLAQLQGVIKTNVKTTTGLLLNQEQDDSDVDDSMDELNDSQSSGVAKTMGMALIGLVALSFFKANDVGQQRWLTADDDACPTCIENEGAGWINVGDAFPSGHTTTPAHPECRCRTVPKVSTMDQSQPLQFPDEEDDAA